DLGDRSGSRDGRYELILALPERVVARSVEHEAGAEEDGEARVAEGVPAHERLRVAQARVARRIARIHPLDRHCDARDEALERRHVDTRGRDVRAGAAAESLPFVAQLDARARPR